MAGKQGELFEQNVAAGSTEVVVLTVPCLEREQNLNMFTWKARQDLFGDDNCWH